jgi:hypothetical protein
MAYSFTLSAVAGETLFWYVCRPVAEYHSSDFLVLLANHPRARNHWQGRQRRAQSERVQAWRQGGRRSNGRLLLRLLAMQEQQRELLSEGRRYLQLKVP